MTERDKEERRWIKKEDEEAKREEKLYDSFYSKKCYIKLKKINYHIW